MAFNLAKKYPELLEIMHYNEFERKKSLRAIFDRDITDNDSFKFNDKQIRPTKKDGEIDLSTVFHHLTTEEVEEMEEDNYDDTEEEYDEDTNEELKDLVVIDEDELELEQ